MDDVIQLYRVCLSFGVWECGRYFVVLHSAERIIVQTPAAESRENSQTPELLRYATLEHVCSACRELV